MASSGPRYPTAAISLANAGTSENANAWTSPTNVGADDATEASITAATFDSPDISEILVASAFGFTIPAGATIDGITVEIDRRGYTSTNSGKDFRVQLATGTTFATLVGSNKAATDIWQASPGVKTYGGAADNWSAGLTAAQVNDAGFAVFLSAYANVANADIAVDYIRVTIDYTAAAATNANAGAAMGTVSALAPTLTADSHIPAGLAQANGAPNLPAGTFADFQFEGAADDGWSSLVGGGGTIDAVNFNRGAQSLYLDLAGVAKYHSLSLTGTKRVIVGRLYLRVHTWATATSAIVQMVNANGNLDLQLRSGNKLRVALGATVGADSAALSLDTWYRIDFKFDTSTGDATADYMIDGSAQAGATKAQATADMTALRLGQNGTNTYQINVDDLLLNVDAAAYPLGAVTISPFLSSVSEGVNAGTATASASALAPTVDIQQSATTNANAGAASGAVTAPAPSVTGTSNVPAGVATGSVSAPAPTTTKASNAPAGVAIATGNALGPSIAKAKDAQAGVTTGSAIAATPAVMVFASAGCATATATANTPSQTASATAGAAAVTIAASAPSESINASAGVATAAGTALAPTAERASSAPAGIATATASALSPTATADSHVPAGVATATATAYGAAPTGDSHAQAGVATVAVAANDSTTSTTTATNAQAGIASVTAAANAPSLAIDTRLDAATGVGTAPQPGASVGAAGGSASVTTNAPSPSTAIAAPIGVASVTANALGPTINTATMTNAQAGVATATGEAWEPTTTGTSAVNAQAGVATITVEALAPTTQVSKTVVAGVAQGNGDAATPAIAIGATGGLASVIAEAWGAAPAFATTCNAGVATVTATAWSPTFALDVHPGVALAVVVALDVLRDFGPPQFMTGGTGFSMPQGTTMRPTTPRFARD